MKSTNCHTTILRLSITSNVCLIAGPTKYIVVDPVPLLANSPVESICVQYLMGNWDTHSNTFIAYSININRDVQ